MQDRTTNLIDLALIVLGTLAVAFGLATLLPADSSTGNIITDAGIVLAVLVGMAAFVVASTAVACAAFRLIGRDGLS